MNSKSVGATSSGGGGGGGEDYILIRDEKANNVDGGSFTNGAWRTRDLNIVAADTGGNASLASNQITLAAGTYKVRARCPAYAVASHKAKLYNITDAADIVIGSSEYSFANAVDQSDSTVIGRFTLAATKVLELQHRCATTAPTRGFGRRCNFGVIEVYSEIEFWKEA